MVMAKKRLIGVTFFGILAIAFSIMMFISYLPHLHSLRFLSTMRLLTGLCWLICGVGVLRLLPWARLIALSAIYIIDTFSPLEPILYVIKTVDIYALAGISTGLLYFISMIVYFTRPRVKEQFKPDLSSDAREEIIETNEISSSLNKVDIINPIQCANVLISPNNISEMGRRKKLISIRKEKISAISLQYGTGATRPVMQAILSFIVIALGLMCGIPILRLIFQGTTVNIYLILRSMTWGSPLIFIGSWLLIEVLQRRYYLLVNTSGGSQKIVFRGKIDRMEIMQFIRRAQLEYSYNIDTGLRE